MFLIVFKLKINIQNTIRENIIEQVKYQATTELSLDINAILIINKTLYTGEENYFVNNNDCALFVDEDPVEKYFREKTKVMKPAKTSLTIKS